MKAAKRIPALQPKLIVTKRSQQIFLGVMAFVYLSSVVSPLLLFVGKGAYVSSGTWIFQIVQWLMPLLFFGLTLPFAYRHYRTWITRLYVAAFLALTGLLTFGALAGLEYSIRFKWFPPVITDIHDNSLWTVFGHEWLVMLVGLALYLGVIGMWEWKLQHKK
jgi:hypothetical protein